RRRPPPRRGWRRSPARSAPDAHRLLVRGLAVEVEEARPERLPRRVVARARRVLLLERLVAPVVGRALGEVSAARRLHHAVDHGAMQLQGVKGAVLPELARVDDLLAVEESA